MTVLNVNDYCCSGESGTQPASTNPSLQTKKTKNGPFRRWLQFIAALLEVTVRSGMKHLPCNWGFTHNAAWKSLSFFQLMLLLWMNLKSLPAMAGRFIFTEATGVATLVICSSVHVDGRVELSRLWLSLYAGDLTLTCVGLYYMSCSSSVVTIIVFLIVFFSHLPSRS